ncbi:hypothetical protein WN51_06035 [Melipona quadrifasciata]|uniref:Uncharacterized protein n=1 Tax=Melipona quadrifasciata TaxID=166423 RepID=A0A0M8ZS51_9HYME|nr:hypothetical protein WN51_06035 [Melipona quadrifasciata]
MAQGNTYPVVGSASYSSLESRRLPSKWTVKSDKPSSISRSICLRKRSKHSEPWERINKGFASKTRKEELDESEAIPESVEIPSQTGEKCQNKSLVVNRDYFKRRNGEWEMGFDRSRRIARRKLFAREGRPRRFMGVDDVTDSSHKKKFSGPERPVDAPERYISSPFRVESSVWARGLRSVEKEESEKHTVATLNEANTLVMRRPGIDMIQCRLDGSSGVKKRFWGRVN